MVTATGEAKIVDFGLARRVRPLDGATGTQTAVASDTTSGTPAYMAPETLRGEPADKRSDIWALGVVLHEMVTGSFPFDGRTMADITSAILRDAPRPLPTQVPLRRVHEKVRRKLSTSATRDPVAGTFPAKVQPPWRLCAGLRQRRRHYRKTRKHWELRSACTTECLSVSAPSA